MFSAVTGWKRQKNFSLIVHGDNNKFIRCKQKESTGKEEEFIAGIGFYWLLLHNNRLRQANGGGFSLRCYQTGERLSSRGNYVRIRPTDRRNTGSCP